MVSVFYNFVFQGFKLSSLFKEALIFSLVLLDDIDAVQSMMSFLISCVTNSLDIDYY